MANLSKSKLLFGFTSPRTLEKIIPEIELLIDNFEGEKWSGNQHLQQRFFQKLSNSNFYNGETNPSDPALAARDRITRAPKALGFIELEPKIKLTKAGSLLLSGKRIEEIFTRQLIKFQLPSPYHIQSNKLEFKVKPYLELIRLIKHLDYLSKSEIALFFSQIVDYSEFTNIETKIKRFRQDFKAYNGSHKMYVHEYFEKEIRNIFQEEIKSKKLKTRESIDTSLKKFTKTKTSNMKDYADAFIRYLRATKLITFQEKTFRMVISPQKKEEVDFILAHTKREPAEFKDIKEFKEYLFDPFTISLLSDNKSRLIKKLQKLGATNFDSSDNLENLKDALEDVETSVRHKNIEREKDNLKHYRTIEDIVHVFDKIKTRDIPDAPLFLEWNVWRSFTMLNYALRVDGNFVMDIEGMPLNIAPGNKADLEIEFEEFVIMGEVTLSCGATQFKMESDSVPRHFGNIKRKFNKDIYCFFIAPSIHEGCLAHFFNLNRLNTKHYGGKTKIIPLSLDLFIEFLKTGVECKFSNPKKLRKWLENQWVINQTIEDEETWNMKIKQNIYKWPL